MSSSKRSDVDDAAEGDDQPTPSHKRRRTSNSISDSICSEAAANGILERVTVKNFMCHDHLEFKFSPKINFVQGRNGSGKSAILTAVVVGLGGQTRSTNRGSSLKELIKYGKNTATVEIVIKNCGRDAFKPDQYGESVVVERKINASGGGGYRIKAKDGTVVSTKKEELSRIVDHYNLQVENPVTVLNQDMSRSFLNSTDPQDLYSFFLKATQLQQMKEDYKQLQTALNLSNSIIDSRKEYLPLLKKEEQEHRSRYEFCRSLVDKRQKVKELRRELIWSKVIETEREEAAAQQKFEAQEKICSKLEEKVTLSSTKHEEEQQQHKEIQEKLAGITIQLSGHAKETKLANEAMLEAKKIVKDKQMQLVTVGRKNDKIQEEILQLKKVIEKDHNDAQTKWAAQRALRLEKIEGLEKEMSDIQQEIKTEDTHHNNIVATMDMKKESQKQIFLEEKAIRSKCSMIEQERNELKGQQSNIFNVYGKWVPQILKDIDDAHNKGLFSAKPVGPLGTYIKLRDPRWGHVAEEIIGRNISAFCVNNKNDFKNLNNIFDKRNLGQRPTIIVARFRERVHDVSRFEVISDEYQSLWSILDISNMVVANTLIDQNQVESTLLIPTAQEAGQILKNKRTVPRNCRVAYTLNRDIYYPDPNYRIYSGRGKQSPRYLQVSVEQKIRDLEADLTRLKEELRECHLKSKEAQAEMKNHEMEIQSSDRKLKYSKGKLMKLRGQISNLKNQEEPAPPDLSQLEEDIKQQETTLKEGLSQHVELEKMAGESKENYKELLKKYEALKEEQIRLFKEAENIKEKVATCESRTNKLLQQIEDWKQKKKGTSLKMKEFEKELKTVKMNLAKEAKVAEDFLPRVETRRSSKDIHAQFKALEARLNEEDAQHGDPLEIVEKYKEVHHRLKNVTKEIETHSNLIKKINQCLEDRLQKYKTFRRFSSILIKASFRNFLNIRKLFGTLHFDFEKRTLVITVSEPNKSDANAASKKLASSKKAQQQTLAMMSGGERSFCTVSFILALWEAIDSPIRILDEFDVFMDIVARKQSMMMMIQAAKPKTQYIYLTPLDLNKEKKANIEIYRMPDPERNEED